MINDNKYLTKGKKEILKARFIEPARILPPDFKDNLYSHTWPTQAEEYKKSRSTVRNYDNPVKED